MEPIKCSMCQGEMLDGEPHCSMCDAHPTMSCDAGSCKCDECGNQVAADAIKCDECMSM